MVDVNFFSGSNDNEVIENAIKSLGSDRTVVIPQRNLANDPERKHWLLDRAILLPENTTVVLQNCTIKLSDRCRDNFFRSANCGLGIEDPKRISNIHIRGEGLCTLLGADHPRAVGDGSKILANPCPYTDEDLCRLADWVPPERKAAGKPNFFDQHSHSFGTDAGKEGESQYGDWRGIGVLLANVEHFSVSNLRIIDSHGWGISLEACAYGRVEKIEFDARMHKKIDGMLHNMENQDGINLRNGCHHIIVSDITGRTGDDVVALTAIAEEDCYIPGGSLRYTHVMHNDWSRREKDIHDVIIRNIIAYSSLCFTVRLLPANTKIWNVMIDGVIDSAPNEIPNYGGILLGCNDFEYGKMLKDGISNLSVSNVTCNCVEAVIIYAHMKNCTISNVTCRNPDCPAVSVKKQATLTNVKFSNLVSECEEIRYEK